jgi:hypothetical protein
MRGIALLCTVLFVVLACGPTQQVQPGDGWISPLPRSAKGYELYSWRAVGQNQWRFSLVSGTNRLKTVEEITTIKDVTTSAGPFKLTAQGLDELKLLLRRLPRGESVTWIDGGGQIGLPDPETVREVQDYCQRFGIELSIAARPLSQHPAPGSSPEHPARLSLRSCYVPGGPSKTAVKVGA